MSQKQKETLKDYLIKYNFNIPAEVDVQALVAGMRSFEIIEAMEEAKVICDRLKSTSLGKELI